MKVVATLSGATKRGAVSCIAWLGEFGVQHDSNGGTSESRVLNNAPAEARPVLLSARRVKINRREAKGRGRTDNVLCERASDTTTPVSGSNEDSGQPRREVGPNVHLMVHQHGRAQQLVSSRRNKRDRQLATAAALFQERDTISDGEARPQIRPFALVPLREERNVFRMICKKLDLHATRSIT